MRIGSLRARVLLAAAVAAAWPTAARADGCFNDQEEGPAVCNCTASALTATLCTSSTVTVAGEQKLDAGMVIPGLALGLGTKYSQSVAITQGTCITTSVPPGGCAFLLYNFYVCITTSWEDGWFGPTKSAVVTIAYTGVSLEDRPVRREDCRQA